MLNGKHELIDRKTYEDNFLNALSDIELITPPMDAFVPTAGENGKMFVINQLSAEYMEISKRMPISLIEHAFGPTNALVVLLKAHPSEIEKVHDDLFLYFCLFKYLDQIDIARLDNFSNYNPITEYIINNISLKDWKSYMVSKRTNEEKYAKKCEDLLFNPDIAATHKFYLNPKDDEIPKIDVVNLMMRLVSNTVVKDDIIIVLGVYMIITAAMIDFNNEKVSDSPCIRYVKDVLSQL